MSRAAPGVTLVTGASVLLVTGTPRSGTSLVMQMLGAGGVPLLCDDARPADADNPRGYCEYDAVRRTQRDSAWLRLAEGRAVKVVHALVPYLPAAHSYRVIDVRRPPVEVLRSQRRMLLRRGGAAELEDDAALARLFLLQREAMERWVLRVARAPLLRLEYPQLVADPAAASARLCEFSGLPLDVAAMTAAVEPALYRERGAAAALTPRAMA